MREATAGIKVDRKATGAATVAMREATAGIKVDRKATGAATVVIRVAAKAAPGAYDSVVKVRLLRNTLWLLRVLFLISWYGGQGKGDINPKPIY